MFQSHNGAIAASSIQHHPTNTNAFQSHNGAIAARHLCFQRCLQSCFNPTMVRLLPDYRRQTSVVVIAFQSHNGAIAAVISSFSTISVFLVSIPQWCDCCREQIRNYATVGVGFNPTMVRLLRDQRRFARQGKAARFNPTMVRLLLVEVTKAVTGAECFNPTMVRLLPSNFTTTPTRKVVSIPQWCDCYLV